MDDPRSLRLATSFLSHRPIDAAEEAAVAHLLVLLRDEDRPFSRATLPTHVTASAIVFDPLQRLVLLHLHRRLDRWLQPGGHIELEELPENAALRETREETGVAVNHPASGPHILHLDEHPGPDGHIHLDLRFLLLADGSAPAMGSGEPTGEGPGATLRWVSPPEVAALTDSSLARAVVALESHLAEGLG